MRVNIIRYGLELLLLGSIYLLAFKSLPDLMKVRRGSKEICSVLEAHSAYSKNPLFINDIGPTPINSDTKIS